MGASSAQPSADTMRAAGSTGVPGQAKPFFQWVNDARNMAGSEIPSPVQKPMTPASSMGISSGPSPMTTPGGLGITGGPNPVTPAGSPQNLDGGPLMAPGNGLGVQGGPSPMTPAPQQRTQGRPWIQGRGGAGSRISLPFYG